MRRFSGLMVLVSVGLLAGRVPGAAPQGKDQDKDKVPAVYPAAVFAFEERGPAVKDYGAKVADILFARLAVKPELYLVDRADLKKIMAELELNLSGTVKASEATKVGH